ncbi:MAG: aminotransferase class V-fold PLP-dependent enzyme [Xenophilus sp.]
MTGSWPELTGGPGFSEDELERLRAQTPAWGHDAHFAHGSASQPPAAVYAAWARWLDSERSLGSRRAMDAVADELQAVHSSVARLIAAQPHQIALQDSASHAWSTALASVLATGSDVHVVSTHDEYGSNSLCLLAARGRLGLTVISGRDAEQPLSQRLAEVLAQVPRRGRTVVSLSAVPTAHGVATDLRGVADVVRQHDGLLFVDASHAVGQVSVDVEAMGCDVLVFPARKWLRGPKGVAVLYVSDRALERLGIPLGVDVAGAVWTGRDTLQAAVGAQRFEGHEFNPGLRLALKAACDESLRVGPQRMAWQNARVRDAIVTALHERLGWEPLEGDHPRATALMTYALPAGAGDGQPLVRALWKAGINVSAVGMQHARWALEAAGVAAVLRLTPHFLTGEEEIERLVQALGSRRAAGIA